MTDVDQPSRSPSRAQIVSLVAILVIIAASVGVLVGSGDYSYKRYTNLAVGLMLLFNQLAYQFNLTGRVATFAKWLAWIWLIFAMTYIISVFLV